MIPYTVNEFTYVRVSSPCISNDRSCDYVIKTVSRFAWESDSKHLNGRSLAYLDSITRFWVRLVTRANRHCVYISVSCCRPCRGTDPMPDPPLRLSRPYNLVSHDEEGPHLVVVSLLAPSVTRPVWPNVMEIPSLPDGSMVDIVPGGCQHSGEGFWKNFKSRVAKWRWGMDISSAIGLGFLQV